MTPVMRHTSPRVSVIMPAFNAAEHLERAVRSILGQTLPDLEFIVGDDGSSDATRTLLDTFDDARIVRSHSDRNIGSLRTRNRLLGLARGEFVAFQDSDDESVAQRLETLVKRFESAPELGAIGSNCDYVDAKSRVLSYSDKPTTHEEITAVARSGNPFVFPTLMVRRKLLDQLGGFREFFWDLGNYDLDWTLRLVERARCANIIESLVLFRLRWGSNSLTIRNPRKLVAHHLALFLADERRSRGTDSLDEGRMDRIDEFFRPLEDEFSKEPSRHFRELAGEFARRRAFGIALRAAIAAVRCEPSRMANYRAVGFVARHALTRLG